IRSTGTLVASVTGFKHQLVCRGKLTNVFVLDRFLQHCHGADVDAVENALQIDDLTFWSFRGWILLEQPADVVAAFVVVKHCQWPVLLLSGKPEVGIMKGYVFHNVRITGYDAFEPRDIIVQGSEIDCGGLRLSLVFDCRLAKRRKFPDNQSTYQRTTHKHH